MAAQERLWAGMEDDTEDLIRMLCTRAGMIMEDASVDALTMLRADPGASAARLERLAEAAHAISAIVAAARTLQRW